MSIECEKVGGVNLSQGVCDTEVPVALVWQKILTAPDQSSLTVYQDGGLGAAAGSTFGVPIVIERDGQQYSASAIATTRTRIAAGDIRPVPGCTARTRVRASSAAARRSATSGPSSENHRVATRPVT